MSEKRKITSKEQLEFYIDLIIFDDWLDTPIYETEEERLQYLEFIRRKKMEILKRNFDICIEDDK